MAKAPKRKGKTAAPKGRSRFPLRAAAIDVGSNAIRFLAAEFKKPGTFDTLAAERATVRLGHDVFLTGRLTEEATEAAMGALTGFSRKMADLGVSSCRAVATSAVRSARNGQAFVSRVHDELKLTLEMITGAEEARLVLGAVRSRIDLGGTPWLIADLGGGSVEVSLADASGIRWCQSHTMGSVRLLEELAGAGAQTGRFNRLLEEYVGTLKVPPLDRHDGPAGFIATGGNMETLAKLAGAEPDSRGVSLVPAKTLRRVIVTLARLSYRERVEELGLREDRADVILPAAMVYERLCKLAGLEEIHVPYVGVREGVILDLVADATSVPPEKDRREDEIRAAALNFGRRFMLDETHTLHVARLALSLFDQLQSLHGLGAAERRILLAASILHDVGQYISYRKHHKHSMYLIAESELPGLSDEEILMAANVARYHRKREPVAEHDGYMKLSEPHRAAVSKLSAILRIADALDREHAKKVKSVQVMLGDKEMVLKLAGSGDMMLEMWSLGKKASLFSKVFNLKVRTVIG